MSAKTSELEKLVHARHLPATAVVIEADAEQRAALAERFGLEKVESLRAEIMLEPADDAVIGTGRLDATILQNCAVSGDPFPVTIAEPLAFRFVHPRAFDPDEEIELESDELDEIEFEGDSFDLGEAVAQSLGLAIDPYAEGPDADTVRKEAGISRDDAPSGPLADALKGLKLD